MTFWLLAWMRFALYWIGQWMWQHRPVRTAWGRDGEHWTPYRTQIRLFPKTPWGQPMLHIFWRPDGDPDCHDHPWGFWTYPFIAYKEVRIEEDGSQRFHAVRPYQWHWRPATYRHRIYRAMVGADDRKEIVTFVWKMPGERNWGFWIMETSGDYRFVTWQDYIYGNRDAS